MGSFDQLLADRVAVVTGGANGIGKGIAMAMARFGANVVVADVDMEQGEKVVCAIRSMGREALLVATDASQTDQLRAMVEQAVGHFGHIDILVNNAGGGRPVAFLEQSERSWRRHIELNLMSMLAATHAAAANMVERGRGGVVINIASTESLRAAPGYAVYAACKAGMVSFTRSMALELGEHDIRVFALAPDMIVTPGLQPYFDKASDSELAARDGYVPLGRTGSIEEIGEVAVFLASSMANYLTGLTIPVDGGATASSGWSRTAPGKPWRLYHG